MYKERVIKVVTREGVVLTEKKMRKTGRKHLDGFVDMFFSTHKVTDCRVYIDGVHVYGVRGGHHYYVSYADIFFEKR